MIRQAIDAAIDGKTKPIGSLGELEAIARKIALIQGKTNPSLNRPTILVFAGDHGITAEGVSAYPSEVTWQMVHNYLAGGAAINVFARQNGLDLRVVDAGVAHEFGSLAGLIDRKKGMGTLNFRHHRALTSDQLRACFRDGEQLVEDLAGGGTNVIGFGEMGIGNTSAAAILMSVFCRLPIEQCTGRGAGLADSALAHKVDVLRAAMSAHGTPGNVSDVLQTYAGFEMAMMCGAMLEARRRGMLLLIDGFIVTSVLLAAHAMEPTILDHCLFAHCSDEHGHRAMLDHLGVRPLLSLGLRLGEGTGAALAYPLVAAAVAFLNEMASFDDAGVSTADG